MMGLSRHAAKKSPTGASRRVIAGVGGTVVLILAVLIVRWGTQARQSAVRLEMQVILRQVAQAARAYQQQFNAAPTLDTIVASGWLDSKSLRAFSRCEISPAQPGAPSLLLVQTVPCRAVRQGEAWGGPGEKTDRDLPACRYVLMDDWSVHEIEESDYQRAFAGTARLRPAAK
jgi:hypothetical protein